MSILIVGNEGAYGSWMQKRLIEKFGENFVKGVDKKQSKDIAAYAMLSNIIINCSSMSASKMVMKKIVSGSNISSLIIDLTTSKKEISPIISHALCDYALIHPMSAPPEDGRSFYKETTVYVIDTHRIKRVENWEWFNLILNVIGGKPKKISLSDHNRMEEIIQSIPHRIVATFAEAIISSGYTLNEVESLATPVSKPLCEAVRRHFSKGNADTFAELQKLAGRGVTTPMGSMMLFINKADYLAERKKTKCLREEWKKIKVKLGL